jgi:tRNA nucleotidyltransferase/poly(A) polymerase
MGNLTRLPVPAGRLKELALIFREGGRCLYLVGGAVRDLIRGGKPGDWDLATDAVPGEIAGLFSNKKPRAAVIPTGIQHGTVTLRYRGGEYEITTFRSESAYRDGRRPESVSFAKTIEEDLSRRDFTMNSIAMALPGGEMVDPFGGFEDIQRGLIRCVGNPPDRFGEDGLRPLRAIRFAAQLGYQLDGPTLQAIRPALGVTAKVSQERIRDELNKIVASPRPSPAFRLMEETGLLELLIPELALCRGLGQGGFHRFDVLDHSLLACDYAAGKGYPMEVRLAALLHDTGKAEARREDDRGVLTFYQHEKYSAQIAERLLTRLRYSRSQTDQICRLIGCHMFNYDDSWSEGAVRRFIIRAGEENLENIYLLRRADVYGMAGKEGEGEGLAELIGRVDRVLAGNHALSLKDLAVNGRDLMALGIKPGRRMGIILKELLETVVDDPDSNNREALLKIALKFNGRYQDRP